MNKLSARPSIAFALALLAGIAPGPTQPVFADNPEPPREIPLVEKPFDQLADVELGPAGRVALAFDPKKWRHAETPNFILHFRRVTEAKKVAREVEYDLWFVAGALHASKESYSKRSHVFIFEDEREWHEFLAKLPDVPSWFASFAMGDELFLNVRSDNGRLDSHTLAHECTHAVVARLYPEKPWPLYLNEGFAEHMGSASVAARKNQTIARHQSQLDFATDPLDQLIAISAYPQDELAVASLYQSSEKLVRYLFTGFPVELFPTLIDRLLAPKPFPDAIMETYGSTLKNYAEFEEGFAKFANAPR